jgi:PAS domain S-box-containing protein
MLSPAVSQWDEQFNQMADNIRDVLWLYEADYSRVLYISPAYETVWGRTRQSLYDDPYSFLESLHAEDRARTETIIRNEHERGHDIQYRIVRPDGTVRWIWDRGFPVRDEAGQVYRVAGICEDITERRKAEEEFRRVSERLQLATSAARIGIWDWNVEKNELVWDDAMYRLYGVRKEDFSGAYEAWEKTLAREDLDRAQAALQAALRGEREYAPEFRIVWPDGSVHFITGAAQIFRDENGRPVRLVGLNYDITEQKLADERITLLQTITMDVASAHDLPSALEIVLRRVCEKTGWAVGQAWLPRQDGTGLACYASWFATSGEVKEFRALSTGITLHSGEGLPGRVYASRRAAWIRDVTQDLNFPRAKAALAGGLKAALAVPILSGDETIAILEFYLSEPREEDERLVNVIAAVAAQIGLVLERKRAEEKLRWSEERLRLILDSTAEGIFGVDLQGRCTFCNASSLRLLGYDHASELLQKDMHALIAHSRANGTPYPAEECPVVQSLHAGSSVFSEDDVFWRRDRVSFPAEYWSYPIFREGRHLGAVVTFLDVTERKLASESLRLSEERFLKAFQSSPEAISIHHHRDGSILEVNGRWESVFGYSQAEAAGHTALELGLIHSSDRDRLRGLLEKEHSLRDVEVDLRTRSNEVRHVSVSAEQIVIDNELCSIFLHHDITERKRAEQNLEASTAQLRALSARLQTAREEEGSRIAREIHDELGSLLTSLRWDLERLAKGLSEQGHPSQAAELSPKVTGLLALTDTMIGIVRRIASELRPSVLDVLGLLDAIQWQARQFSDRTGIAVHCNSPARDFGLNGEQSTTAFRIFQEALTNILRHAHATIVDVAMAETDGTFILKIRDNGRGITEQEKSGPSSIGLLGMRERAHLIGADLKIDGSAGEGTTVALHVPVPRAH